MYRMWDAFRVPSMFVTFAPYDVAQPILVHNMEQWHGDDFTCPTPASEQTMSSVQSHRKSVQNPVAVYLWYRKIKEVFYKEVLGFDVKKGRARRRGGLFGHVRVFCGCTEDQERCSLHNHVLIWLLGTGHTSQELKELLEQEEWTKKFLELRDQIVSTSYACSFHLLCPQCESSRLGPLLPHFSYQSKNKLPEPASIICLDCGHHIQATSVIHHRAQQLAPNTEQVFAVVSNW
jgi:Helitron helicase-like domain at N-terminus